MLLDRDALDASDTRRSSWLEHGIRLRLIARVVLHSGTTSKHHFRFAPDSIGD